MVKKLVKDPKESKACSPGTKTVLRSSNRLRGKSKQAPEARNIVKAKTPTKRTTNKETPSKKKVDVKTSKVVALKKGSRGKSKKDENAEDDNINGTNKILRSSKRLKEKDNADKNADVRSKGKRKQAPQDRDVEKLKSPQKRRNISEETLIKRKSEDPKKSKVVAAKKRGDGNSKRHSNSENDEEKTDGVGTSKGKRKQAPQDKDVEKLKSPQKKRNIAEETLIKRKSEDPKKSKVVAAKKRSYGKSKRHSNAENDEEKTDDVGTSNVLRSSNRRKGKVDADEMGKGKSKRESKDGNTERGKRAEKLTKDKVENAKNSKDVALRKVGRGKLKKDVTAENDKERIHSAGSIKSLRSSRRLAENTKADKGKVVGAPEDKNAETFKGQKKTSEDPQKHKDLVLKKGCRGKSKRVDNAENDKKRSDSAGTSKIIRSSKIAESADSSQKTRKASNENTEKKKLPKRKVVNVFKEKDAKVEKRKMPDRTCRSIFRTKK